MVKCKIRLSINEVPHFVDTARRCDFDIDIAYNHCTIDAKSILGVYALDFKQVLEVTYNGFNQNFEDMLQGLAIAG